eukprot:SAG25_NODE_93_length_16012_cov_22.660341_8_plen_42_part_00
MGFVDSYPPPPTLQVTHPARLAMEDYRFVTLYYIVSQTAKE